MPVSWEPNEIILAQRTFRVVGYCFVDVFGFVQ